MNRLTRQKEKEVQPGSNMKTMAFEIEMCMRTTLFWSINLLGVAASDASLARLTVIADGLKPLILLISKQLGAVFRS